MKNKIIKSALMLLIMVFIGLFIYDAFTNKDDPTHSFYKYFIPVICCIALLNYKGLIGNRRPIAFYESHFSEEIGEAFSNDIMSRKKLLCAIRLYDEDNLRKSAKYLIVLRVKCKYTADVWAVSLFSALVFTDMQLYDEAINEYIRLIELNPNNSMLYSNLGMIYVRQSPEKAQKCYEKAIELDSNNVNVYNNMASLCFYQHELDNAIEYAEKALAIEPTFYQSASLLAIIYTLRNDKKNTYKYYDIAVSNGEHSSRLDKAIEYYKSNSNKDDALIDIPI